MDAQQTWQSCGRRAQASAKPRLTAEVAIAEGLDSGRSLHLGAASKCEHWRGIDLVDLRRMGLLKPIVGWRIRGIMWKRKDGGRDEVGVIPGASGILFVKRGNEGKLASLLVTYTFTATMFGGHRKWFSCPGCRRPCRVLYGANGLLCRRCRGLKYASQSEASHWRAQRKASGIRRRLGASGNSFDGPFPTATAHALGNVRAPAGYGCHAARAMGCRRGVSDDQAKGPPK
jgi:hypothetical protein